MIPNQWYAVLESREVKRGRLLACRRLGENLVCWRSHTGQLSCLVDKCAHRGVALSAGKVLGSTIQCPFHGIEYDVTGQGRLIPANGKNAPVPDRFRVPAYPTREAHGLVWMWWGRVKDGESPPAIPYFEDLDEKDFSYATIVDPWNAHYSRAIENQLDAVHLPFVHYNTIGRGNRTLVHGPRAELHGNEIRLWVHNVVDDGATRPLKPEEMDIGDSAVMLRFIFPNIWENCISDDVRVTAAFVPVDAEHTLLYLRFYQKFLKFPGLKQLVTRVGSRFNRVIAHQDRRVVVTQVPRRSELKSGENLIQGDNPIILYRRRRQELIEAATITVPKA